MTSFYDQLALLNKLEQKLTHYGLPCVTPKSFRERCKNINARTDITALHYDVSEYLTQTRAALAQHAEDLTRQKEATKKLQILNEMSEKLLLEFQSMHINLSFPHHEFARRLIQEFHEAQSDVIKKMKILQSEIILVSVKNGADAFLEYEATLNELKEHSCLLKEIRDSITANNVFITLDELLNQSTSSSSIDRLKASAHAAEILFARLNAAIAGKSELTGTDVWRFNLIKSHQQFLASVICTIQKDKTEVLSQLRYFGEEETLLKIHGMLVRIFHQIVELELVDNFGEAEKRKKVLSTLDYIKG